VKSRKQINFDYNNSAKGRERDRRYHHSAKGRARDHRRYDTDAYREWNRERMRMANNPRAQFKRILGIA
jgi:hypothetical protein